MEELDNEKYNNIESIENLFKRIIITLNDGTKYKMMTAKKIKGVEKHEMNLNNFVKSCVQNKK